MMSSAHNANHINKAYSRCCLMCVITSPARRGTCFMNRVYHLALPRLFSKAAKKTVAVGDTERGYFSSR